MSIPLAPVVRVVSALICMTLTPLLGFGQVRESRDWKRLSAADLTVVGNAGPAELRRAATNIEEFRNAIRTVYPNIELSFSVPTVLVVFRNEADFARTDRETSVGVFGTRSVDFLHASDVAYLGGAGQ